jgi:hypothetical protein
VTKAQSILNLIEDINSQNVMNGAEFDDLHRDDEGDEGDEGTIDISPPFDKSGAKI